MPKGVVRPAMTAEDVEARHWLMDRAAEAGLEPSMDRLGNTIAKGSAQGAPRLLAGSHSDTQPTGGWLDGALGVIYALEAARALRDAGGPSAIDVINFQDEEGRFGSLVGSSVYCGGEPPWDALSLAPTSVAKAETMAEAAAAHSQLENLDIFRLQREDYFGFLEAHIEQGRRLERLGQSVAAVDSIVGMRQFNLTIEGQQNHAGSTAMEDRADAGAAAFSFATALPLAFRETVGEGSSAVWTIGKLQLEPGAASIIPGKATLVVQFRDPEESTLDRMEAVLRGLVQSLAAASPESGVSFMLAEDRDKVRAIPMNSTMVKHVQEAAEEELPGMWQTMHSGAIHDAGMMASRMPAVMLFVPSINGVSHDFTEDTHEHDIVAGAQVYAKAAARMVAKHHVAGVEITK